MRLKGIISLFYGPRKEKKHDNHVNHKNYSFLDCDWFKKSYFPLIHSPSCCRIVFYRTVFAGER